MNSTKEEFDFICSLGGNCMAAAQLYRKNLRLFSLPFDWLYMKDSEPIKNLITGFETHFKNFMQQKNMRFVPQEELPENGHKNRVLYQDTATGYYFLNHFDKIISEDNEFKKVQKKMLRRLKRFFNCLDKSTNILFLLTHSFYIENKPYIDLYNELKKIYPEKQISIRVIQFDSPEEIFEYEHLKIYRFHRKSNIYDFINTNIEWAFLDHIKCNLSKLQPNKLIISHKLKKGISIVFLPILRTIFTIKLYVLGIRFIVSIGKPKIEDEV